MSGDNVNVKEQVVDSIKAMKDGPRAMRMYMEMCVKCGTCASVCPVYYGKSEKRYNPAERTDLIRRIYRKYNTVSGRVFGKVSGAEDFDPADLEDWQAGGGVVTLVREAVGSRRRRRR